MGLSNIAVIRGPHLLDFRPGGGEQFIATAPDGTYNDGGALPGVVLEIEIRGNRKWKRGLLRYSGAAIGEKGTLRIPLGSITKGMTLAQLRRRRAAAEAMIERGEDPRDQRIEEHREREQRFARRKTVAEAIVEFYEHCWNNRWGEDARKLWGVTLKKKCLDPICASPQGKYQLRTIDHTHVAEWLKGVKGKKLHSFFCSLFSYYIARKIHPGPNPAGWGEEHPLTELLPKQPPEGHYEPFEVDDVPLIVADLMTEIFGGAHPGYWSTSEAAVRIGCDSMAIYAAKQDGRFPGAIKDPKHPSHNLYPIEEVKRAMGRTEFVDLSGYETREDARLVAYALLFLFLTMVRPKQARLLKWGQIHWEEQGGLIKYLPETPTSKSQHKTGHHSDEVYVVILSDRTRQILRAMQERAQEMDLPMGNDDYVFAHGPTRMGRNAKHKMPLSRAAFKGHLRTRLKNIPGLKKSDSAPSGMRKTFPKWAYEFRGFDHVLIDATLGHRIPPIVLNRTNKHYFYGQVFIKRRRKMIASWEKFMFSRYQPIAAANNVIPIPLRHPRHQQKRRTIDARIRHQ